MAASIAASGKSVWGFSPQSIPGCQLWLDAADSSSITGTSSVTAWKNKGAAGGSASTTNGTISTSASINSRGALSIGFQAKMTMPSLTFAQTGRTVFVVATVGNSGNFYIFLDGTTNNIDIVFFIYNGDNRVYFGPIGNPVALQAAFPGGSFNAPSIISGISAPASNLGIYVNGTALSLTANTGGTYTTGTTTTQVTGSFPNEAAYTLGEILFFDGALTREQQQQVEGYLAAKWGLLNQLPIAHPYSSVIPILPTQISGCQLWLDAADQTSMVFSSGSNVSLWRDKSGLGNNAVQATAGNQPTYTTDRGHPAILFNAAANNFLDGGPLLTTTSYSIFIVYRTITPSTTQFIFFVNKSGNTCYVQAVLVNSTLLASLQYSVSPNLHKDSTPYASTTNLTMYEIIDSPGNITSNFFANGAPLTTASATAGGASISTTDSGGYILGTLKTPAIQTGNCFNGYLYEIIVFNSALSITQRQLVEQYLGQKWKVSVTGAPSPGRYLIPTNRPFYPTDIAGCTLWMDGADRSSMAFSSGSNISRWNDKSGLGNDFTVTEGTPVLSTTTTGNPGVFFPTNSQMQSISNAAENGAASRTSFFVADVSRLKEVHIGTGSVGTNTAVWGFDWTRKDFGGISNSMFGPYTWAVDVVFRTAIDSLTTTTNIGFAGYNSNTAIMSGNLNFSNVDSNRTTFTPATAAGPWWMGDRPSGGTIGFGNQTADNGWICEFIQYNTVLTTPQRQQVESYLSWKWKTTASLPFPTGHPGRLLPAFSTNFTPKSVAGCQLWLDAADSGTVAFSSGTTLSTWRDKSGNGNDAVAFTKVGTPSFSTNALNGLPSVTYNSGGFDGTIAISGTTLHAFAVTTIPVITNFTPLLCVGQGVLSEHNNVGFAIVMQVRSSGTVMAAFRNSAQLGGLPLVANTPFISESIFDGTNHTMFKTGTAGTSAASSGSFASVKYCTGNTLDRASTGYNGSVSELLIFGSGLTTPQRQQVEGYLAWKWGLQSSLPSTHAYAKFAP